MDEGWVRIDRSILHHWVWNKLPFSPGQAWIDLILLANWKDNKTAYKGEVITCKRGDVNLSLLSLAKRWQWSTWKVRNFINLLESDGMVTTTRTTHRTTITIVNYSNFQLSPTTNQPTNQPTSHQQATTTNKGNKDNNTLSKERVAFSKPTLEEVTTYCRERNNGINAQHFIDFYESKGWKVGNQPMKDWKAAVRTWESRNGRNKNTNTGETGYTETPYELKY